MRSESHLPAAQDVQLIETHISWVVLAGDFAYKIKKPIRNSFLDYSTQEARARFCEAELRLNRRFAPELYLDVVPITHEGGSTRFAGGGKTIEKAVRMRRFPADALMSARLTQKLITTPDVRDLAARIARFHQQAERANVDSRFGSPPEIYQEALDNCRDISEAQLALGLGSEAQSQLAAIEAWTIEYFNTHRESFELRKQQGSVRECHGDLHLGNIVWWQGELIPFDGIEFSEEFRWIDTLSDAAFTAMDLAACDRWDLSRSFLNAYFETTGDYAAVRVLTWYLVFRAMVRAKVAALRGLQLPALSAERQVSLADVQLHLQLARRLSRQEHEQGKLWITHGVSGSGKTTGSEHIVQQQGAFRVRADVERKRLHGAEADLYTVEATRETYLSLAQLAEQLIRDGESVIVDATFLKKSHRQMFRELAGRWQVPFAILHFEADRTTLQQRIRERATRGRDASDADTAVLESQLVSAEPLDEDERMCCVNPP